MVQQPLDFSSSSSSASASEAAPSFAGSVTWEEIACGQRKMSMEVLKRACTGLEQSEPALVRNRCRFDAALAEAWTMAAEAKPDRAHCPRKFSGERFNIIAYTSPGAASMPAELLGGRI